MIHHARNLRAVGRPTCVALLIAVLASSAVIAEAPSSATSAWNQWLGNAERSRHASATLDLGLPTASTTAVGRELWRQPYGSGYSSVSIEGGLAVSARADGDGDFVTAHDATTGDERWRVRLEATYEGHDGSHDGPLSTPAIVDGAVYALSARGRLVVLDAKTGTLRWERDLVRQDRAKAPSYGFATSPLVTDGLVLVQGGGRRGHSLSAFDSATGEKRWAAGDEAVRYSSPARMTAAGVAQAVVATNKSILGVRLSDGEVLWRHAVPADDFTPLPLGDDRLFVSGDDYSFVLRIGMRGDEMAPEVVWRTSDDEGSWGPVLHDDGVLYAQDGDDNVIGVDATAGTVLWRQEAVNGTLIRVGMHLVLLAYGGGDVLLFEATRDGARSLGTVASLEQGQSNVRPSFANGTLYLRSRKDLRAVRLEAGL